MHFTKVKNIRKVVVIEVPLRGILKQGAPIVRTQRTNLFRIVEYEGMAVCLGIDAFRIFGSKCQQTIFWFRNRV